jgi:hypothetical protein
MPQEGAQAGQFIGLLHQPRRQSTMSMMYLFIFFKISLSFLTNKALYSTENMLSIKIYSISSMYFSFYVVHSCFVQDMSLLFDIFHSPNS